MLASRTSLGLVLATLSWASLGVGEQPQRPDDLDLLQGEWRVVYEEVGGEVVAERREVRAVFRGGLADFEGPLGGWQGTYILTPSGRPRELDYQGAYYATMQHGDKVRLQGLFVDGRAAYRLEGDYLRICTVEVSDNDGRAPLDHPEWYIRPNSLVSDPGSKQKLLVLRRGR